MNPSFISTIPVTVGVHARHVTPQYNSWSFSIIVGRPDGRGYRYTTIPASLGRTVDIENVSGWAWATFVLTSASGEKVSSRPVLLRDLAKEERQWDHPIEDLDLWAADGMGHAIVQLGVDDEQGAWRGVGAQLTLFASED